MQKSNSALNYLQIAHNRRLKQEQQDENIFSQNIFYESKPLFKTKLFYDKNEHKFDKTDIPQRKIDIKKAVKETKDPDVLELKKARWQSSTLLPVNPENEETHARKLWKIKLGLADGQNLKEKDKKIYQGTETRDHYGGWNPSTLRIKKKSNNFAISSPDELAYSSKLARKKNSELLPVEYRSPQNRQIDYTNFIRQKKEEERPLKEELRQIYSYENPGCSQEKLQAGVQRLNYETKLKAGQLKQIQENLDYTFTPDISRTVKRKQIIKQNHSGIWTKFLKHKENGVVKEKWAYSCCQNEDFESEGCNRIAKNLEKWNTIGFTNR